MYTLFGLIGSALYAEEAKVIYNSQAGEYTLRVIEHQTSKSPPTTELLLKLSSDHKVSLTAEVCGILAGAILEGISSNYDRSILLNEEQTRKVAFDKSKKILKIYLDSKIAELSYEEGIKLSEAITKYYTANLTRK